MLNLLTAFVLFHFNAHWIWWTGFAAFVVIDILVFLLEALGNK